MRNDELEDDWRPTPEDAGFLADCLALRYPEHAELILENRRLDTALVAVLTGTFLSLEEIVAYVGDRELKSARRPIDVLVSRCMSLISEASPT